MTSFGEDTFHHIYAVTTNGPVYRLVPPPAQEAQALRPGRGPGTEATAASLN